ncbi:MAG: tyrosine--tRNA ligase [Candidatus Latescibacteria bacterium]|nr:tyrosine--tRNA ligase [Candidatus Latescibacterota bacterium]
MSNVFDTLQERGFVRQVTDEEAVRCLVSEGPITCYIGFDPSADSLHVGNLVQIMALAHLQRAGHRPIVVIGGGTMTIGDPSGKTEMRQMLSPETISLHTQKITAQLSRYLDFESGAALAVNNADWLLDLNYVDFLRDIGRHFSVNRMLAAEAYRARMETGLSFIEFNYQLLQAYDYLTLFRRYDCRLQMGGDDQWGNILAGVDLIRRVEGVTVEALTTPLLTTATGAKMGKTAEGAIWLDPEKFFPYDFYQYWINVDDRDVERFLACFTFLPMEEVRRLGRLKGADIRQAKEVLAYEATKITHGESEAKKAQASARSLFGWGGKVGEKIERVPATTITQDRLASGIHLIDLLVEIGLAPSKSEARRLIRQGGVYINGHPAESSETVMTTGNVSSQGLLLRVGKKKYRRVVVE